MRRPACSAPTARRCSGRRVPLARAAPARALPRPGPGCRGTPPPRRRGARELTPRRACELDQIVAGRGHYLPGRLEIARHAPTRLRKCRALCGVKGAETSRFRAQAQALGSVGKRGLRALDAPTDELVHTAKSDLAKLQSRLRERRDLRAGRLDALSRPLGALLRKTQGSVGVRAGPKLHEPGGRQSDLTGKVHACRKRPIMTRCSIVQSSRLPNNATFPPWLQQNARELTTARSGGGMDGEPSRPKLSIPLT
jgi:hypothetical protein